MLAGRGRECEVVYGLVDGARSRHSAGLVICGEAGVGKSALLDDAVRYAHDLRVVRVLGVESEMELPFAALHQLCGQLLDRLQQVPAPQRDALATAFGLRAGPPPDRFLVGLAVLSLLSEVATERPLFCVLDDAQWLDHASSQTLAFVARRLLAESILMIFATRNPSTELRGLPQLQVGGLGEVDARQLLHTAAPWPVDERVLDRIVTETRGNPLALLELPRGLSPVELAGGFVRPDALPLSGLIEESFRRQIDKLSDEARLLLVVAAADPVGDPALVWRAARELGLGSQAADDAATAGLIEFGTQVVFRHPLVRSAVYRAATNSDRQRAHATLAEVTDPKIDPDRRAWHRAQATAGADEDVAIELEQSAGRAQRRGGLAAAAAFLERTVTLTIDPAHRARRAVTAAEANLLAGAPTVALRLLVAAETGPLDELDRARVDLLRAEIAYAQNRGSDAPQSLLLAAARLAPLDPVLARQTYLDALWAVHFAGRLAQGTNLAEVGRAALTAPAPVRAKASDLLLEGLATSAVEGYAAGVPALQQAVSAFRRPDISAEEEIRWLWHAGVAAMDLWDDESFALLAARHIELGQQTGALSVLPIAFSAGILAHTFAGRLQAADQLIEELRTVTVAMGSELPPYGPLVVAAWRGREPDASKLIEGALRDVAARGEGAGVAVAHYASAVLHNGLGRYREALVAAAASDQPEVESFTVTNLVLGELIEAAVRSGSAQQATNAMARLSEMTMASGTDWALGLRARSQALLLSGAAAEDHYREALDRFGRTRIRVQLARAHLLYGQWLRREKRRVDAREQLRTAHQLLSTMGVEGFAEIARRELLVTGETARKRTVDTLQ
ncbi:MAG: AAA family ATPase, partial [Nakamurella sp.]